MELIKCHVENFGKLENFDYEFKKGLNTIKENNGFGKTTFAVFIKSMFYGMDAMTRSEKSDRKKYMPWQGGKFGGNIEFEIKNKKYRIERFFGKKAADDTFKLYDLETNLESKDYTENIGEEIFKINKDAYERSTYIPQGKIQIEMDDSINAKLGNVLENENDLNTSDEAIKRIEETMKLYKKTGNRGILNEKIEKLSELKRKLENSKSDYTNLEVRKEKLKQTIKDIKEKESLKNEKQKLLNQNIDEDRKKAKLEVYNTIINSLKQNEEKNEKIKEFFAQGIPTDEELDILSKKCLEIEKYKGEIEVHNISNNEEETLKNLEGKFNEKELSNQVIDKKIGEYNEIRDIENKLQNIISEQTKCNKKIEENERKIKSNKKFLVLETILTIVLIIVGIILLVTKNYLGIGLIVLSILGIVLTITKKQKNKNLKNIFNELKENINNLEETKNGLNTKKENIENNITEFIKMYEDNFEDKIIALTEIKTQLNRYQDLKKMYDDRVQKNQEIKNKVQLLEDSIKEYLLKYFNTLDKSYSNLVNDIKVQKNELTRISEEIEKSKKSKQEFEEQNNLDELKEDKIIKDVDEDEVKQQIAIISKQLDELNDEKNQNKNQIEVLENKIDEVSDLEAEIDNLEEEIEELKQKYKILEKTKKYMALAKEKFSSHYLKGMVDSFNENLQKINDYELKTDVDINLGVKVDANGSKKEIKYFSEGYKDLVYICMRFSLVKVLFEDELPFIILDDPLVNLDDEKTEKAINLINDLSKQYQIIYFICNTSRE